MWDLVLGPGTEPGPPALGVRHLSPWTTREAPPSSFLICLSGLVSLYFRRMGTNCVALLCSGAQAPVRVLLCSTDSLKSQLQLQLSVPSLGSLCPLAFCLSILLPFSSKECDYFSLGLGLSQSLCTIKRIISLRLFIILKADFPDRTYTHGHKPKENKTNLLFYVLISCCNR